MSKLLRFNKYNYPFSYIPIICVAVGGIKNGIINNPGRNSDEIKFVNVVNLYTQYIMCDDLDYVDYNYHEVQNYLLEKYDLLFTRSSLKLSGIAQCNIYLEDYSKTIYDDHIMRLRLNKLRVDPKFVRYYCISPKARKHFMSRAKTGTMTTIGQDDIASLPIPNLEMPEQQKIASFLTLIDAEIDRQRQKVDALEEYKKGLLKKIFSQEIRFKDDDGNDYPDWRFMKFSDVYELLPTNSFSREKMSNTNGIIHNIHYGDIHTRFSTILDVESATIPYIINSFETTNFTYCIDGDLIIADASEDYKDIGKAIEIVNVGQKIIVAGLHTILARNTSNLISLMYSGYMMQSALVHKQIQTLAAGAKVLGISKSNIASIVVPIPDKDEQSKIVMLLHNLDNIISLENDKLDHLAIYKKGLLQQMFV